MKLVQVHFCRGKETIRLISGNTAGRKGAWFSNSNRAGDEMPSERFLGPCEGTYIAIDIPDALYTETIAAHKPDFRILFALTVPLRRPEPTAWVGTRSCVIP
jgi:hypothetical protein